MNIGTSSQVFYEIALSIGNEHQLKPMLKEALTAFVRKLICKAGAIYQLHEGLGMEQVQTVPRRVKGVEAIERAEQQLGQGRTAPFQIKGEDYTTYVEKIPSFGVVVFVKSGEPFAKEIVFSLRRLYKKLGQACYSCLQAEKIQKNEELYRLLVNTSRDAILLTDMFGTILYASPSAEQVYGWPQKALVGASFEQSLGFTKDKEVLTHALERIQRGESGRESSYRIYGQDKKVRWLDHSWDVAKRGSQLGGTVHFVRNITEELKQERQYKGIIEMLPSAIYFRALDRAGEASFISPQITDLLGYFPADVVGNPDFFQSRLHPDDRDWVLESQKTINLLERESSYAITYRMMHKEGHTVWVLNQVLTVRLEDGTPDYICGILIDVTERKKAEEGLAIEEKKRERLQRLLSPAIAQEVISGNVDIEKGGELRETSVLFTDIRGFTSMSEASRPQDIVNVLNEYFERMIEVLFKYEGTLDKFVGDEIMALFGAPVSHDDDPLRAVKTAIEMRDELAVFNEERLAAGLTPIQVGMGINTGECVAGYLGSSQALDYTVIGDPVNVASRLCSVAKTDEIMISESTYEQVKDFVEVEERPPSVVKGKSKPLKNYNVLGLKP